MKPAPSIFGLMPHVFAATAALYYAWVVSQSAYVNTALQFVAPVIVIMMVHLGWLIITRRLSVGFSGVVYARTAGTAFAMASIIVLSNIFAPKPAFADVGDTVSDFLSILFCAAIIVVIGLLIALVLRLAFKAIGAIFNLFRKDDGPDTRLFDIASLTVATVLLAGLSAEGVTNSYTFATENHGSATQHVDATPGQVWATLQQATSPDFPLPDILSGFPQPVAIAVDEGTDLGAMRRVDFEGREGAGALTLQVVDRSDDAAVFQIISDTTPYAHWIKLRTLTYRVLPDGDGTQLTVTLDYDRALSPSWFFSPAMKGAAHLGMGVLARDVKARAEG